MKKKRKEKETHLEVSTCPQQDIRWNQV